MTADGYILKHIADLLATIDRLSTENEQLRAQLAEQEQESK